MSRVPVYALTALVALAVLVSPAHAQAVISTHSGLVHHFEGAVYISGQRLEDRLGKFTSLPEGGELRTEYGRAELLLTPGVFLRVGEKSSIRMLANALSGTRVELLTGSAIVDSADTPADTSVTLVYKDWSVHQGQPGRYRVDSEPARVQVADGEATVTARGGSPVKVGAGSFLPLENILSPEKSGEESADTLSEWVDGRNQAISADNSIAANIQDPASLSSGSYLSGLSGGAFTSFPMLALTGMGSSMSAGYGSIGSPGMYGFSGIYQPGFYSYYLPAYNYRPASPLRLPTIGSPRPVYPLNSPIHVGLPPTRVGQPVTIPHAPTAPHPGVPVTPHPAVAHPVGHK